MINIFFAISFMVVSFSFFFVSTSINAVNRAVLYIPIEIFQKNVYVVDVDSLDDLYFRKLNLITDLNSYFKNSLSKYVHSYSCAYAFTNNDFSSMCLSSNCQGIRITVKADICFDIKYQKIMYYSIGES